MAVKVKASVKSVFEDGDKPTGADFVDLIDSYQDASYGGSALSTVSSGATGLIDIESSASATTRATGAIGIELIEASATSQVVTLASAGASVSAGGGPGGAIVSADTTAAAQALLNITITSGATPAEASAATASGRAITPANASQHPGVAKAWAVFDIDASIAASYNVSGVADNGTGDWTVNFSTPFANASYVTQFTWRGNNVLRTVINNVEAQAAGSAQMTGRDLGSGALSEAGVSALMVTFWGTQ